MRHTIFAVLLLLLSAACTFEPELENFIELSQIPSVQVGDIYLSNTSDTFQVFARTARVEYDIDVANEDTILVTVYVDDHRHDLLYTSKGNFVLHANDYEEGYHSLRLEAVTNTGTGSIADKLGAEGLVWSKEWTFLINFEPPQPVNITAAYPEDGRLIIEWEESNVPTEKLITVELAAGRETWSYRVSNAHQTRLVDTVYTGGDIRITLENIATNPDDPSPIARYNTTFPTSEIVKQTTNELGHVTVYWNRPLFHRNFGKYTLKGFGYNADTFFESEVVSDTSAIITTLPFGETTHLILFTISEYRKGEFSEVYAFSESKISVGEKRQRMLGDFVHAPLNPRLGFKVNSYYAAILEGDSVVKEINDGIWGWYAPSSKGEYLYFSNSNGIARLDREGNIIPVLDPETVYGEKITPRSLSLGDDRYLCFTDRRSPTALYIYDVVDKKPVSQRTLGGYEEVHATHQTPDGKYLAVHYTFRTELHTLRDGVIQQTKTFEGVTKAVFFDTAYKGDLIMFRQDGIEVYNMASDKSIVNSFDATLFVGCTYDPITGYIGGSRDGHYYVIDPATGSVLRDILVAAYFGAYNGHLYALDAKLDLKLR